MIDKDLHTALFELEKNLQDLSSAKQQIDEIKKISSDVVSAISSLQTKYSEHLTNIEETHNLNLENYKKGIDAFVSNLENEFNNIVTVSKDSIKSSENSLISLNSEYTKQIKDIEKQHYNHLSDNRQNLDLFIKQLSTEQDKIVLISKDNITSAKNEFSQFIANQKEEINKYHIKLIASTKDLINQSIENLNKSTEKHDTLFSNQDEKIKQHLNSYQTLIDKVTYLLDYIQKIDFPSRLDKIDNTISGINIGLQNLQGIVNDIQREQLRKFEQLEKLVNENIRELQNGQDKQVKRTLLYFIILLITIMISTIIIKFA